LSYFDQKKNTTSGLKVGIGGKKCPMKDVKVSKNEKVPKNAKISKNEIFH